jgi:hypothetical protein
MNGTDREILGHTLHEPKRGIDLAQRLETPTGLSTGKNVVLKFVNQLVRQYALKASQVAGERHNDAVTQRLRRAASSFTEVTQDVVLAKLRARSKKDDRLLFAELVVEDARQARV